MSFKEDLKLILGFEGGYANDPDDPGGATNKGVTQSTYNDYRKAQRISPQDVKLISDEEVETIYLGYYKAAYCDKIERIGPPGLSSQVFDFAINAGPGTAIKTLQKMLGSMQDGIYGPATETALLSDFAKYGVIQVNARYQLLRMQYYIRLAMRRPTSRKFLLSWLSRTLVIAGEKLA